jgi:polymorphic membrane protein
VIDSTFSINSADFGGGIDNFGKLIVATSTFVNNEARGEGGGILSSRTKGASAIIDFSTIYGNTANAGGGIWIDPKSNSQVTLSSSIIAANRANVGPDIAGTLISGGYNLVENETAATGLNATTDKQVTLTDLKIDSTPGNNGGPTQTLALLQGSIASDAVPLRACSITVIDPSGQNVTITTDQRGNPRPDGSENVCDMGAYESSYQG